MLKYRLILNKKKKNQLKNTKNQIVRDRIIKNIISE